MELNGNASYLKSESGVRHLKGKVLQRKVQTVLLSVSLLELLT